jgi:hypothetical protein
VNPLRIDQRGTRQPSDATKHGIVGMNGQQWQTSATQTRAGAKCRRHLQHDFCSDDRNRDFVRSLLLEHLDPKSKMTLSPEVARGTATGFALATLSGLLLPLWSPGSVDVRLFRIEGGSSPIRMRSPAPVA